MKTWQIKAKGRNEVQLWDGDSQAGELRRHWWPITMTGTVNGTPVRMSMAIGLGGYRWSLQVAGEPVAAARSGRLLGLVKSERLLFIEHAGREFEFAQPHRKTFEWALREGEERVGFLGVTPGWQPRTPLALDVELDERLPVVLAGFLAYLASRAFTLGRHRGDPVRTE